MNYESITSLYRQIGREFRKHGADRVILLSSKMKDGAEGSMQLEVAVDGPAKREDLEACAVSFGQDVEMKIIMIEDDPGSLEAYEMDGILL